MELTAEETADALYYADDLNPSVIADALRQAERDGALRAIDAALTELRPTYRVSVTNLENLRTRITRGEFP